MAINKDIMQFLRKKSLVNPTADDLYKEFQGCIDYCMTNNQTLTKGFWLIYLSVVNQTYLNWQNGSMNKNLNDTEFNERLEAIKKIDATIETGMTEDLLKATKNPAGIIFYLKNAFKWSDRQEPEVSLNLKIDGYNLPKTGDNKGKEGNI
jgi:hypothetical protein